MPLARFKAAERCSGAGVGVDSGPTRSTAELPNTSAFKVALVLSIITLWTAITVLPHTHFTWSFAGLVVLTAISVKTPQALYLGLFCTLAAIAFKVTALGPHPLPLLTALSVYTILVICIPAWRPSLAWIRFGSFEPATRWLVVMTIVLSSVALLTWYMIFTPDMREFRALIPPMPFWMLPLAGLAFAVLNAATEEAIYRGIMMQALEKTVGAGMIAVLVQALSFGVFHLYGFPRGILGVLMASTYGLMLGFIRFRSSGMFAPWLAHVVTDLTIFMILVLLTHHEAGTL